MGLYRLLLEEQLRRDGGAEVDFVGVDWSLGR